MKTYNCNVSTQQQATVERHAVRQVVDVVQYCRRRVHVYSLYHLTKRLIPVNTVTQSCGLPHVQLSLGTLQNV